MEGGSSPPNNYARARTVGNFKNARYFALGSPMTSLHQRIANGIGVCEFVSWFGTGSCAPAVKTGGARTPSQPALSTFFVVDAVCRGLHYRFRQDWKSSRARSRVKCRLARDTPRCLVVSITILGIYIDCWFRASSDASGREQSSSVSS